MEDTRCRLAAGNFLLVVVLDDEVAASDQRVDRVIAAEGKRAIIFNPDLDIGVGVVGEASGGADFQGRLVIAEA